ncbi:uncharacterized protein F5147DRAFT_780282 [Suillus discolor]|uniref:Uncharacterized protein n=1 Tax=Suillus discolor TaxID=1912936 RepID=A0A9P7EUT7_9AGAM|nr:uncharacterized protein F5147DRAFT_780282 [Suillus discolor]KAG2090473.1 hypothetical protein F5147DRAFT_780282 [Suillus discolor]
MSSYTCICKRSFTAQNYYTQHQHSCSATKKCLSSAISSLKDFIGCKKKLRISKKATVAAVDNTSTILSSALSTVEANASPCSDLANPSLHHPAEVEIDELGVRPLDVGEDLSLTQHRPRRQNQQLPLRFRDMLPQPPPTIPAELRDQIPEYVGHLVYAAVQPMLPVRTVFRTPPNIFGLIRQYFSATPPSHDPEEYVTMTDLSFIPSTSQVIEATQEPPSRGYYPYPNQLSFQLELLEILGSPSFNAANVSSTKWKNINYVLGSNEYQEGDGEEWEDEDAGWRRSLISIKVPSSRTTKNPGAHTYEAAAHLYHRSLVAVLREKLANP